MRITAFSLTRQTIPYVGKLAEILELFDAACFATKPRALRDTLGGVDPDRGGMG